MKKITLKMQSTIKTLLCLSFLFSSFGMLSATDYCHTPIVSADGTKTIYLTAQSLGGNEYEFKIESDEVFEAVQGSNLHTNVVGQTNPVFNIGGSLQLQADNKTLTTIITSSEAPFNLHGLFLEIKYPGTIFKNFNFTNDINWAVECGSVVQDNTPPTMGAASVVGSPTSSSVVLALNATDDITNPVTRFVVNDVANGLINKALTIDALGHATLTGLLASTPYNLTITAKDAAGNVSTNSAALNFTTKAFVSQCSGSKGHFAAGAPMKINYEIKYIGTDVVYTITPYEAGKKITFAEVQTTVPGNYLMTIADDELSATYTHSGLALNTQVGIRFLYAVTDMPGNEMTAEALNLSDANVIVYAVGDCAEINGDTEAPVMVSASIVDVPTHNSVTLELSATDNVTNPVKKFIVNDATNALNNIEVTVDASDHAVLGGLIPETTYNLTITAKDAAGNISANSVSVSSFTTTASPVSACTGSRGHFADGSPLKINYEIKYIGTNVIYTITPYEAGKEITGAEVQTTLGNYPMVIAGDKLSATYTHSGLALGIQVGIRFLYAVTDMPGNEMTSQDVSLTDAKIIKYVVGDCFDTETSTLDKKTEEIICFPSIVSTEVQIKSPVKIQTVKVYNTSGQRMKDVFVNDFSKNIDVQDLTSGYYMFFITDVNGNTTARKIIKK